MGRYIDIQHLAKMDDTAIKILQVISKGFGEGNEGFIPYNRIAKVLGIERDTVRKAVNRMIARNILVKQNGKLSIPASIVING